MVIKTALKILLFFGLIYLGWYLFSFVIAWLGIFVTLATVVGFAAHYEKKIRKYMKDNE
jgi:CHASE2 domain-containing sensor protein